MSERPPSAVTVSFDSEPLILVDEHDREIGFRSKRDCHQGHGLLHRAFSVFLFDSAGRLLLQQRSDSKPLWPLYWSNSCCSHPRRGETMQVATRRRLKEELGLSARLEFLYKFIYQADFGELGAEHELCWVYIGLTDQPVRANPRELADWRWLLPEEIDRELDRQPDQFTPWFKLEWQALRSTHRRTIEEMLTTQQSA